MSATFIGQNAAVYNNAERKKSLPKSLPCEVCSKPAKFRVFRGISDERENRGHLVCRKHALADVGMTAIEPVGGIR